MYILEGIILSDAWCTLNWGWCTLDGVGAVERFGGRLIIGASGVSQATTGNAMLPRGKINLMHISPNLYSMRLIHINFISKGTIYITNYCELQILIQIMSTKILYCFTRLFSVCLCIE